MVQKVVVDSGDNGLECFNRAILNYEMWQAVPVRYHTRGTRLLFCWVLQWGTVKDEKCIVMVVSSLSSFAIATFSLPIVYIMTNRESLPCLHEWVSYYFTMQIRQPHINLEYSLWWPHTWDEGVTKKMVIDEDTRKHGLLISSLKIQ